MDSTTINLILYTVIILGQIVSFYFLSQQIKSKNRVIEDLQVLLNAMDIKKLTEYFDAKDKLREQTVVDQANIIISSWYKENYADWGYKFDEVVSFAASLLEAMPPETREMIIKRDMPHCRDIFAKYFEGDTNKEKE